MELFLRKRSLISLVVVMFVLNLCATNVCYAGSGFFQGKHTAKKVAGIVGVVGGGIIGLMCCGAFPYFALGPVLALVGGGAVVGGGLGVGVGAIIDLFRGGKGTTASAPKLNDAVPKEPPSGSTIGRKIGTTVGLIAGGLVGLACCGAFPHFAFGPVATLVGICGAVGGGIGFGIGAAVDYFRNKNRSSGGQEATRQPGRIIRDTKEDM